MKIKKLVLVALFVAPSSQAFSLDIFTFFGLWQQEEQALTKVQYGNRPRPGTW